MSAPWLKHVRNVAIILALAAAVAFLPGGGESAAFISWVLSTAFLAAILLLVAKLYRERRTTIYGLGDSWRAVLYGALGALTLTLTGTSLMWSTVAGRILWIALLVGVGVALWQTWRASQADPY